MLVETLNTTAEEQELVERIHNGDAEAFRILFERYRTVVYRFCQLMVNVQEAAEDIYQETFVVFYEACCKGEQFRSIKGYLMTVARNRCLNLLRDRQRNVLLEENSDLQYEYNPELAEIKQYLQDALLQIPEHYREAFLLFEVEGYSYNEIAEYSGVDRGIVKNRIYRAKQSLRKILGSVLSDNSH